MKTTLKARCVTFACMIVIAAACDCLLASPDSREPLCTATFKNPPLQARPSALWTWLNGNVDHQQITKELEEMKAKGMKGAIIWDLGAIIDPDKIIPAGPEFFGPESLKTIHHAMDEAERLDLELGIVASSSWNAGGTWITPKDASKKLLWSELKVDGPAEFSGPLPLPEKIHETHQDIAVYAIPQIADEKPVDPSSIIRLDDQLDDQGQLKWSVPKGSWKIVRFINSNTGELLNCPSPNSEGLMIDHLSAKATTEHMNHMLDKLVEGREGYGPVKMMMFDSYEVRPAIDWTPEMVAELKQRRGYDPQPWLPVIAGWTVKSQELSERFLHDYHKTVGDLLAEDHFAKSRELLNERGLQLLAEAGHGGYARVDPLKALGASDIPMGEFWNHRKNWVTKEAASAAHIYGKTYVNSESFTGWQHWQDGPAAYKRLFDIALCAGLNQVTFHTFSHNPPEAGLPGYAYHAGEHFNLNATWWNQAGPMLEDMARACHLLQQGKFVADLCVYYGDEAPNLVPARRLPPTIRSQWDEDHCDHCGRPNPVDLKSLGQGYDYDYMNEEVILTRLSVQDGKLVLPDGMSYKVMVLPDRESISPAVMTKIQELVKAGATIVGTKPKRSNSLSGYPESDATVQKIASLVWGDCDGQKIKSHRYGRGQVFWNTPLKEVMNQVGIRPDFDVIDHDNSDQHIDYIHRQTEKEDIYFVSNSSMEYQSIVCAFRVDSTRIPSFWNAENGSITPCYEYQVHDDHISVPINLSPASSIFVVFSDSAPKEHLVKINKPNSRKSGYPELEILEMDSDRVKAAVWQAGSYDLKSSSGKTGQLLIDQIRNEELIDGPWQVHFQEGRGAPAKTTMDTLTDWTQHTDPGIKYFSGSATYHNRFSVGDDMLSDNQPIYLDLGVVRDVATVRVNGKVAGILWKEPYRVDISNHLKAGENQVEIDVVNTWNNRLVGDAMLAPEKRITRTNLQQKFHKNSALIPSGLLGPVKLKSPTIATCDLKHQISARD